MSLRLFFSMSHNNFTIIGLRLGRHLGYIEMLNDARVVSLRFFEDDVCTTRINKEKKFKIKFQVLLKLAQILPDKMAAKMAVYNTKYKKIFPETGKL